MLPIFLLHHSCLCKDTICFHMIQSYIIIFVNRTDYFVSLMLFICLYQLMLSPTLVHQKIMYSSSSSHASKHHHHHRFIAFVDLHAFVAVHYFLSISCKPFSSLNKFIRCENPLRSLIFVLHLAGTY